MKCFYCSKSEEGKKAGKCSGCGKELARFCSACGIKYDAAAKFCMSCGGRLEDLETPEDNAEQKADSDIEIEFDDGAQRGYSGEDRRKDEEKSEKGEDFLKIDLGIEPEQGSIGEEPTLQTHVAPSKKPRITIEVNIDDEPADKHDPSAALDLEFEKSVIAQKKQQENAGKTAVHTHRKTLEIVENEKSSTDFITKWDTPREFSSERIEPAKKEHKKPSDEINFDDLFSELTSLQPKIEKKAEKLEPAAEIIIDTDEHVPEVKAEPAEEADEDTEVTVVASLEKETSAEDAEKTKPAAKAKAKEKPKSYELTPQQVHETYPVSFDQFIAETVSPEFEESCVPMLKKIEQNFRVCKGGAFFLRGNAGSGKSRFAGSIKKFALNHSDSDKQDFRVVVSDANIFDFDFMIFINLVKDLMGISGNDPAEVREKFDSLFGEALPESKKECLTALICLNFAPVKTKLPKHDIEYLISYVLYCLSRNKPVLWVINNANALNVRTIKFLSNIRLLFDYAPMALLCIVDPDAAVLSDADPECVYDFKGFDEQRLAEAIYSALGTNRIPAEIEKLLREKAGGNMLFTTQLTEYLKDLGFIFEMKGSWRFSKLPDDFVCPSDIDELIDKRVGLLPDDMAQTLKEFTLLNLYSVPKQFFVTVSSTGAECVDELVKKGYLKEDDETISFVSRSVLSALKKMIKIGRAERLFYRETVSKLVASNTEFPRLNKHWLLLSYINLGGIVDKQMNPFLFSSAVYMEKLGFFEISQRSYQTIISSFAADDPDDDFRILPEIKNARLWRIVEPQWAKIFWEKLLTYAKQHFDYHLELLAKSELLLIDEKKISFPAVAEVIKKFHLAGCYEDEFRLIDRTTDILIESGNHLDANTFAIRGYKLLRDVIVKSDGKGVRPAEFIYVLYIRSACKLSEICITLKNFAQASEILEEALNYTEKFGFSYFKSKIMFLLGKIRRENNSGEWEELIKDGFYNALIGMDFAIIKAFLRFFEENGLEDREWVLPFLEYKNWINF